MTTLAVIGTAGRGPDAQLLTAAHWRMMTCVAQTVACTLGTDHLVSGGSAWADAVAVDLYLADHAHALTLHLPTSFKTYEAGGDAPHFVYTGPGARLNELHEAHSRVVGFRTLREIERAIAKGATVHVNPEGFLARNADVAKAATSVLAFTFGPVGNEGGTAHTWRLFRECALAHVTQTPQEDMAGGVHYPEPMVAYHFDLTTRVLTRHVYEGPEWLDHLAESAAEQEERRAARPPTPPPVTTQEDNDRGLI